MGGRIAVSAQVSEGTVWWPSTNPSLDPSGVVVVTVNYNTKRLVSMLLWSLYRFLGSELRSVVAVDNGSSDGSTEILQACAFFASFEVSGLTLATDVAIRRLAKVLSGLPPSVRSLWKRA